MSFNGEVKFCRNVFASIDKHTNEKYYGRFIVVKYKNPQGLSFINCLVKSNDITLINPLIAGAQICVHNGYPFSIKKQSQTTGRPEYQQYFFISQFDVVEPKKEESNFNFEEEATQDQGEGIWDDEI